MNSMALLTMKADVRFSSLIQRLGGPSQSHKVRAIDIATRVAREDGLTLADLVGESRRRQIVDSRYRAMAEIKRVHPGIGSVRVARLFGDRDHTCVLRAWKRHGIAGY